MQMEYYTKYLNLRSRTNEGKDKNIFVQLIWNLVESQSVVWILETCKKSYVSNGISCEISEIL